MYLNFSIATYISTQLGLKELSLLNSIFKQTSPATNTHLGGERINTIHHTVMRCLVLKTVPERLKTQFLLTQSKTI